MEAIISNLSAFSLFLSIVFGIFTIFNHRRFQKWLYLSLASLVILFILYQFTDSSDFGFNFHPYDNFLNTVYAIGGTYLLICLLLRKIFGKHR